jgi:uncharacterized protein (TIGR02145 family)
MKRNLFIDITALLLVFTGCQLLHSCKKAEKQMVVQTGTASNIMVTTADVSGNIVDLGDGDIIQHGHCYSVSPGPTLSNSKTEKNAPLGIGDFTSNLINLEAGTTYYVKAYLRTENEIVYGNEINFKTSAGFLVTTAALSAITSTSAKSGGEVLDDGGLSVTARGICWGTSPQPAISGNHTADGTGKGTFISDITGLSSGVTYFLRAYATNSSGTVYGSEINFISPVTDYDGNTYKTVQIGTQVWMAENLRTTHYRNSIAIPEVEGKTEWVSLTSYQDAYCNYDNTVNNVYGKLYNLAAVTSPKMLCPEGWHVPSSDEWITLINYNGGYFEAAPKLKESGTAHWQNPNNGTNQSGFTALPGGLRWSDGVFMNLNMGGFYWSSSGVYFMVLIQMMSEGGPYSGGFSVRCVK